MYFTVLVPNAVNAMGVDKAGELFPSSHMIENMHVEPYEKEVRITYCHADNKCLNDCQCERWELPQKAAESLMKAWPDQVDAIMKDIRQYAGGFYGFNRWNMFVGVEPDGHIHT